MKSAYELAMERLGQSDATAPAQLTDEQRAALAEIDRKFQAKVAEKEVFLNQKILEARRSGDREAVIQIEKQLQNERDRLSAEKEAAKDRVRDGR